MLDNALYFPYINVPNTAWFTQVLLYWDRVSSIVPYDYLYQPQNLDPHMQNLVAAELVHPVFPADYIYQVPRFEQPFLLYVRTQHKRRVQRGITEQIPRVHIHIEKIDRVSRVLVQLGLARRLTYPWYEVEAWVANAFMAYLAATLGKLERVNSAPVTDNPYSLQLLGGDIHRRAFLRRRVRARELILRNILPNPDQPVDLNDLVEFKAKHGYLLQSFRNRVESQCMEIAKFEEPELSEEKAEYIIHELREDIAEITDAMKERWHRITFGTLVPVLGAEISLLAAPSNPPLALIGAGLSLAAAVYQAFANEAQYQELLSRPLAYAALAQADLG